MEIPINYLAVLLCGVASMILGFLWYGPLFGKAWMKEVGMTMPSKEEMKAMQNKMTKSYVLMFIGALVMAYVLAHSIFFANAYLGAGAVASGLQSGFWNWLGFVVPATMALVLWEKRTWKWFGIAAGYYLVLMLVMGLILASWPA